MNLPSLFRCRNVNPNESLRCQRVCWHRGRHLVTTHHEVSDDPIPRCEHGRIILGCPDPDCPQQNLYLADLREAMAAYEDGQRADLARLLGVPAALTPEQSRAVGEGLGPL